MNAVLDVGGRLAEFALLDQVLQASLLVQLVILLLALASVISWAVILFKWRELRGAEKHSEAFLTSYGGSVWSGNALAASRRHPRSPLAAIFRAAHAQLSAFSRARGIAAEQPLDPLAQRVVDGQVAWTSARESARLERRLSFLATVGSAAPFVGLFGTVLGIIDSFTQIGEAGSASLAVVAPGIAEALIATAIGLLAAIPASVFYNHFAARLQELQRKIEVFAAQLSGELTHMPPDAAAPAAPSARRGKG